MVKPKARKIRKYSQVQYFWVVMNQTEWEIFWANCELSLVVRWVASRCTSLNAKCLRSYSIGLNNVQLDCCKRHTSKCRGSISWQTVCSTFGDLHCSCEHDLPIVKGSFVEKLRVTDGFIITSPEISVSSGHVALEIIKPRDY